MRSQIVHGDALITVTSAGTAKRLPAKQTNSIMGRYEQLQDHSPSVDNVHDVTIELDRKAARYVRALAKKNASQKAARAVLRQRARRQCVCVFE